MKEMITSSYRYAWIHRYPLLLFTLLWLSIDSAPHWLPHFKYSIWVLALIQLLANLFLFQYLLGQKISPLIHWWKTLRFFLFKTVIAILAAAPLFVLIYKLPRFLPESQAFGVAVLLGGPITLYLIARLNIVLPMLLDGIDNPLAKLWSFTAQNRLYWLVMGIVFYLPAALVFLTLKDVPFVNYLIADLFYMISAVFTVQYYQHKKARLNQPGQSGLN